MKSSKSLFTGGSQFPALNVVLVRLANAGLHFQHAEVGQDGEVTEKPKKELFVALTSDRGLCGAVHSSICRTIRAELNAKPSLENVGIICVGDKSRLQLQRRVTNAFLGPSCRILKFSPTTFSQLS